MNSSFLLFIIGAVFVNLAVANSNFCARHGNGNFANPKGCNWFIICTDGVLREDRCHEGLVFDSDAVECVNKTAAEVNCAFDNNVIVACPPKGTHLKHNPYSCRKFFICVDGKQAEEVCPIEQSFSPMRGRCMADEKAECMADRSSICPVVKPNEFALVPSILNCEVYYLCLENAVHEMHCAQGFHFNKEYNWCDIPENVECTPEPIGPTLPNITKIECGNLPTPFYAPHPEDCQWFFICDSGRSNLMRCPDGTLFDIRVSNCNLPDIAECFNGTTGGPIITTTPGTTKPPTPTTTPSTTPDTAPSTTPDTTPATTPDTTPSTEDPDTTIDTEPPQFDEDYYDGWPSLV